MDSNLRRENQDKVMQAALGIPHAQLPNLRGCGAASRHTLTCSFQSIPTLDRAPLAPVSMQALRVGAAGRLALRPGTSTLHTARAALWAGKEGTADQAGGPGCAGAGRRCLLCRKFAGRRRTTGPSVRSALPLPSASQAAAARATERGRGEPDPQQGLRG